MIVICFFIPSFINFFFFQINVYNVDLCPVLDVHISVEFVFQLLAKVVVLPASVTDVLLASCNSVGSIGTNLIRAFGT